MVHSPHLFSVFFCACAHLASIITGKQGSLCCHSFAPVIIRIEKKRFELEHELGTHSGY